MWDKGVKPKMVKILDSHPFVTNPCGLGSQSGQTLLNGGASIHRKL